MKVRGDFQYEPSPESIGRSDNLVDKKINKQKSIMDYKAEHILSIPFIWDGYDTFNVMILVFFGLFTRFWLLHQPQTYTQFEILALSHIHYYLNKTFFVSNHPPFQEMLIANIAKKMEYENSYPLKVDKSYTFSTPQYVSLRSISAFFSMLSIPISYLILRCFMVKQFCSFCGGFFCLISQIMIPTMRNIDISGGILFYVSCSLLFAGLSHHFNYCSPQQILFVFLQGLLAGFSFSSSFLTFPIVIFSIIWPIIRFNSKKQAIINIIISLIILYICCLLHLLYTPIIQDYQASKFVITNFTQFKSNNNDYKQLELKHLIYSYYYMKLLISNYIKQSLSSLRFGLIFRRLFMLEKWHLIWTENGRFITCFTNKLVTFPASIFAYIDLLNSLHKKFRFNARKSISFLFILFMVWNALSCHPEDSGCFDSYLPEYFGFLVFILFIESNFSQKNIGLILIFLIFICGLLFIDWAPIIYAYHDPEPFVHPGINFTQIST